MPAPPDRGSVSHRGDEWNFSDPRDERGPARSNDRTLAFSIMGACLILTPVVVAAWPTFATAVVSAAASLGYTVSTSVAAGRRDRALANAAVNESLQLEVPRSEIVSGQLGRDEKLSITRDGVTITFRRDERGKASLTVSGAGRSHDELRALGEEMSRRVVRDYVHQQILAEVQARDFVVVDESVDADHAIRLTVRQWGK